MSDLTIKTNGHYRPLMCWEELTEKEREWHDWEGADEDSFFRYKGHAYHMGEFMRVGGEVFPSWDGAHSESYFSGVLVKYSNCGDAVKVGTYYS